MESGSKNVLLGITGSVAAVKSSELISRLIEANFNVQVVVTASALHFLDKPLQVPVHTDLDEYNCWKKLNDPVLHIQVLSHYFIAI